MQCLYELAAGVCDSAGAAAHLPGEELQGRAGGGGAGQPLHTLYTTIPHLIYYLTTPYILPHHSKRKILPYHIAPHHTTPYHTTAQHTAPQHSTPHHTTADRTTLHHTTPNHTTPQVLPMLYLALESNMAQVRLVLQVWPRSSRERRKCNDFLAKRHLKLCHNFSFFLVISYLNLFYNKVCDLYDIESFLKSLILLPKLFRV